MASRRSRRGRERRDPGERAPQTLEDPTTLFDAEPPVAGEFVPPDSGPTPEAEPPGDREPPRTRATGRRARFETLARTLVAVPWIIFAILIIIAGGVPFMLAMIGLAFLGMVEYFRMTSDARPFVPVAFAVVAGTIAAAHFSTGRVAALVAGVSFPLMFAFALGRPSREGITVSLSVTLLGIAWIGAPFAHAVLLRDLPLHGGALLVDVLVATFAADTAAYLGGRLFGRHPLAPSLSPNKTIEGLAAGFLGGTLGFWFAGLYQDWLSGTDAILMGACIAVVAPMGDLFESMIKRDLGVKDTGRAFGPHGGLLDRLDAVLFTVVAGFYLSIALVY
ncbi:MAG: phosphatidate cytidylyltransferase [Solirubrobacterales bacterium]